jgi:hypothetical protein
MPCLCLSKNQMENFTLLHEIKKSGLSEEQAVKTLSVVADYAKEKFPILEGNINSYLREEFKQADPEVVSKILGDS